MRFGMAAILATAVTTAMFWIMQTLIDGGQSVISDTRPSPVLVFLQQKKDDHIKKKNRSVAKPNPPQAPPATRQLQHSTDQLQSNPKFDMSGLALDIDLNIDASVDGGASNGEYLPIVKVAPIYPARAVQRGIEGYVLLEFTVTAAGTVTDIAVIDAKPPTIFNRAAIKAASKFKYRPRIIDSKPVDVVGVQNLIRFKLED